MSTVTLRARRMVDHCWKKHQECVLQIQRSDGSWETIDPKGEGDIKAALDEVKLITGKFACCQRIHCRLADKYVRHPITYFDVYMGTIVNSSLFETQNERRHNPEAIREEAADLRPRPDRDDAGRDRASG